MIKVEKDFSNVPDLLIKANRKEAFEVNIASNSYCDDNNRYKGESIKSALDDIYNKKCAYCEQKLLDSPKHIEHYRPKDTYYWLAYSWDNLLLCCTSCNSSKGTNFKIENSRVNYNNETFEDIHSLGQSYDEFEKPYLINPEKDDILESILYDKNCKVNSTSERVKYTIDEACKLNRKELLEKRQIMLNDFKRSFNENFFLFLKNKNLDQLIPCIKIFIEDCNITKEFYSLRYFILKNIDMFFEEESKQKILKTLIKKQRLGENK